MDLDEFYFLISPEAQEILEHAEGKDPVKWVMSLKDKSLPSAALASQLKYRERAKGKVPSWERAGCLFEQRAFEQSTSEQLAIAKPWASGTRALDLTCGMGVDAWAMSSHYEEVLTLEPDRLRFVLARHNFQMLGAENISVWQSDAESWMNQHDEGDFDLIYVDPDRRDETGSKVFRLEDCSPDVVGMHHALLRIGKRVLLKTSPMLDIDAALRRLSDVKRLTVLAVDGECKELLFELVKGNPPTDSPARAVIFFRSGMMQAWEGRPFERSFEPEPVSQPLYIYEADISLYKVQMAWEWFEAEFAGKGRMTHPEGYFFGSQKLEGFAGRAFQVLAGMPWKPAEWKRYLKDNNVQQVNLTRRHFDIPFEQIRKQLPVKEGGSDYLLFTKVWIGDEWQRMCYHCKRIN